MKNYRFYVSLRCFALVFILFVLFMIGCASEKSEKELFNEGREHYTIKNYEEAQKTLVEFLRIFPESIFRGKALRLLAQSYLDQNPKNYNQAYLNFDKLTTEEFKGDDNLQIEAMYKVAYCLKELIRLQRSDVSDETLGRYTEFLVRFPESEYVSDAYFGRGEIYSYKKDYELARINYRRALRSTTDQSRKAQNQYAIAVTYYNQEDFKKASAAFNLLLEVYPESKLVPYARRLIAHIYKRKKEWNKAIVEYEGIIKDYKDRENLPMVKIGGKELLPIQVNLVAFSYLEIGSAYYELAASHKESGETKRSMAHFEKALSWYQKLIDDFPKEHIAPRALSRALLTLCELERKDELATVATKYVDDLRDDEPILSAEAQLKFADALREKLEHYNKAFKEYLKLQDYPPNLYPRLDLVKLKGKYYEGLCYENLKSRESHNDVEKNYQETAEEAYAEAIRLFDTIFRSLLDLRNIEMPHLTKEQKEQFDYCIKTARYYVGRSYFATDQFEKGIVEFEEFLKKADPESERAKNARDNIEKVRQKLGTKIDQSKDSSDASDDIENQLTPDQEIAQIARESTVLLTIEYTDAEKIIQRREGTGFFVRPDLIATNHHVIKGAIDGTARLIGTERVYVIVGYTAVDPDHDLAILKVRAFGAKPLPLGNSDNDNIKINDEIYVVGNPLGNPYLEGTVSNGKISGIRENSVGKWIQMTAPISPGNSGGPLLNGKNEVIGIVVFQILKRDPELGINRVQNVNFAVPVNYLKALLERTGPLKPLSDLEMVYWSQN